MGYIVIGTIIGFMAAVVCWAMAVVSKQADRRMKMMMEQREKHGIDKRD